jgi:hypothetical protein
MINPAPSSCSKRAAGWVTVDGAAPCPTRHLDEDQIPVAEVDELFGHDPIRVPGAAPLGVELAVAVMAPVGGSQPDDAQVLIWRTVVLRVGVMA